MVNYSSLHRPIESNVSKQKKVQSRPGAPTCCMQALCFCNSHALALWIVRRESERERVKEDYLMGQRLTSRCCLLFLLPPGAGRLLHGDCPVQHCFAPCRSTQSSPQYTVDLAYLFGSLSIKRCKGVCERGGRDNSNTSTCTQAETEAEGLQLGQYVPCSLPPTPLTYPKKKLTECQEMGFCLCK